MSQPLSAAVRLIVDDPEALADAIHGAKLRPMRLRGDRTTCELSRLHLPRCCLDVAKLGPAMVFSGTTSERAYTLIFVLDCPVPGRSFNFSTEHTDGFLALFAPGGEIDAITPAGYANASLTVPEAEFRAAAEAWCPEMPDALFVNGGAMRVPLAEQGRLRALLADFSALLSSDPRAFSGSAARSLFEQELLEAFLEAFRAGLGSLLPSPDGRVARREARFHEAREWMKDHLHLPVSIEEVACASGLSIRSLEIVFSDYLGIGPTEYLRRFRLHAARRALLGGGEGAQATTVKEAAMSHGLWHLGRFAAHYRSLFGENPADTLARRRCPV
jgi:AraC-like DNA-binding protein